MQFKKYLHLLTVLTKQNVIRETQYRTNWILSNLSTLGWSGLRLIYYTVAFSQISVIGNWDYAHSLILAGTFMVIHSLYKGLFEANVNQYVYTIYHGDLDFYLTKPISSLFLISMRVITPRAIIRLILGIIIVLIGLFQAHLTPTFLNIVLYTLMVFVGLSIMYSFSFLIMTTAFWFGNVRALNHVPQVITSMSYMPFDVFPSPVHEFITLVIPLALMATIPAKILFQPQLLTVLFSILAAIISLYLTSAFYHFALRKYTSLA